MTGYRAVVVRSWVAISGALLVAATTVLAQTRPAAPAPNSGEWRYTVAAGENLWTIAQTHLLGVRYVEPLRQMNNVVDPHRIPPGAEIRIPIAWTRWEPLPIRIEAARGSVVLVRTGVEAPVQPGALMADGDLLRTGADASALLAVEGRGQLLVSPGSELRVDHARVYGRSAVADVKLRLNSGNAEPQVRRLARGSRFEIVTPAAITAVRGTDFRVGTLDDGRRMRVELTQGRLAVAAASTDRVDRGRGIELAPGQGAVASAEGSLMASPLLPALDLSATPTLIDRLPTELPLPRAPGVVAWRAQVLGGGRTMPAFDGVVTQPRVRFPDLPDGRYTLRARGIHGSGLEGVDALHEFEIDARPEPPFLSEPPIDAQSPASLPTFRWAQSTIAGTRYRLQLAAVPAAAGDAGDVFAAPRADVELAAAEWVPESALGPGRYRWRVRAIDPSEGPGPFSDPQSLRVLAPSPAVEAPMMNDNELVFRWRAAEVGARYEFQFARDVAFADILVSQVVAQAEFKQARPPGGAYYLRVRTIEADGVAGPYGAAQRVDVPERSNPWLLLIPLMFLLLL